MEGITFQPWKYKITTLCWMAGNFFDKPGRDHIRTCKNIRNATDSNGDDYTTGFSFHYTYFKKNNKLIAIDLSKQQVLNSRNKVHTVNRFHGTSRMC